MSVSRVTSEIEVFFSLMFISHSHFSQMSLMESLNMQVEVGVDGRLLQREERSLHSPHPPKADHLHPSMLASLLCPPFFLPELDPQRFRLFPGTIHSIWDIFLDHSSRDTQAGRRGGFSPPHWPAVRWRAR